MSGSKPKIAVVRDLAAEPWRRFVDAHPKANVFHTPEMHSVYSRASRHEPEVWAAVDEGQDILALFLPVRLRVSDGLFGRLTARAVSYGSVLSRDGRAGTEALDLLIRAYKKATGKGALFTELRNLSETSAIQPVLQRNGFEYEEHLNYLLDLKLPVDEMLQAVGRRTRKSIRRELKRGNVVITEITALERMDACYDLLSRTYRAARIPLADKSLFQSAFRLLYPKGMLKATLALVDGRPAAASLDLLFKDTIYGWYGGTDRGFSSFSPNEVLTWHILAWGAEKGYRTCDFGGAGKPGERYGVRDFKAKFGGRLVSFGRNICVHRPALYHLSRLGFQLLRSLKPR